MYTNLHPTLLNKIGLLYEQPAESQQHKLGKTRQCVFCKMSSLQKWKSLNNLVAQNQKWKKSRVVGLALKFVTKYYDIGTFLC